MTIAIEGFVEPPRLLVELRTEAPDLFTKVWDLRTRLRSWLSHTGAAFPHYTSHAVDHSDRIIRALSQLMFHHDGTPFQRWTVMECYVVCIAAYLHDAGMVVADNEKAEVLSSDNWEEWVSQPAFTNRFHDIEQRQRHANSPSDHFLADIDLRYLIVEYFRQRHHVRSGALALSHAPDLLAEADLASRELRETVSAICVGHGLNTEDLFNERKYPFRRDIKGVPVDVRLLTILLRLGDLLDMDTDRACPILLAAAGTVPSSSAVHWQQYQCITHTAIRPDRIDLIAECETQEQYRTLTDWCQWIVKESSAALGLMSGAELHPQWRPPVATMGAPGATIVIERAPGSCYTPSPWRLSLDEDAIYSRLTTDLYKTKFAFLRELLQNSLDASRCRLYQNLKDNGQARPDYPQLAPSDVRGLLPIYVTIAYADATNTLTNAPQRYALLTIEDQGIGMTKEVIARYFLQVGKSFYRTNEFRRDFGFLPTSKFGVGFLSVFSVSDHVTVDTLSGYTQPRGDSTRMLLTGPRNYIITEPGLRRTAGTTIMVRLNIDIAKGELTQYLSSLCRRVEFPIIVNDFDDSITITSEDQTRFLSRASNPDGVSFRVEAFDAQIEGVFGELYFLLEETAEGDSWDRSNWAKSVYSRRQPGANVPELPPTLVALHGLTTVQRQHEYRESWTYRIDYRRDVDIDLSRHFSQDFGIGSYSEITERMSAIVRGHLDGSALSTGPKRWLYLQRLLKEYGLAALWHDVPGTMHGFENKRECLFSLDDIRNKATFYTLYAIRAPISVLHNEERFAERELEHTNRDFERLTLLSHEIDWYADDEFRRLLFKEMLIDSVTVLSDKVLLLGWSFSAGYNANRFVHHRDAYVVDLEPEQVVGFAVHPVSGREGQAAVLNRKNPLVSWFLDAFEGRIEGVEPSDSKSLAEYLLQCAQHGGWRLEELIAFLSKWQTLPGLDRHQRPPDMDLQEANFRIGSASR